MVITVFIGLAIAWFYYGNINEAEDPRVLEAKIIYKRYDALANLKNYDEILVLLDSMTNIYKQYDDYEESYEIAVVYNNKAALFLTIALFETEEQQKKDSLFVLAKTEVEQCIGIYQKWLVKFGELNEEQIHKRVAPIYQKENPVFQNDKIDSYINKRTHDMILAQKETPRRLSVSYTNLGIILRHQGQIDEALKTYKKALDLWDNNLTAENNINIILGRPIREQTMLEKLFPEKK